MTNRANGRRIEELELGLNGYLHIQRQMGRVLREQGRSLQNLAEAMTMKQLRHLARRHRAMNVSDCPQLS